MKKLTVTALCMSAVLLAGCSNVMPNMTDEQADVIGEYAAITLLRYDANSRSRLVNLSNIELTDEKTEPEVVEVPSQPETEEVPDIQNTPVIDNTSSGTTTVGSMEEILKLSDGIKIECTGYEFCQSYQEGGNSHFALEASEGKTLLAVKFAIQNTTGTGEEINLLYGENSYRVNVNGSFSAQSLTTMLDNDLSTYKETVSAGETKDAVLIFEVDSEQAESATSINLTFKNNEETYSLSVM